MRVSVSSIFTSVQHGYNYKANLVRMRTEPCDSATRCEGCRLPASPVVERSAYLRQLLAEQGRGHVRKYYDFVLVPKCIVRK